MNARRLICAFPAISRDYAAYISSTLPARFPPSKEAAWRHDLFTDSFALATMRIHSVQQVMSPVTELTENPGQCNLRSITATRPNTPIGQNLIGLWMIPSCSRRDLLQKGGLAMASLIGNSLITAPARSSPSLELDAFLGLSEKVTGQRPLDRDMGKAILEAFMSLGRVEEIITLMADATPERSQLPIANAIVAAWYTGISPVPGAREVTGFNEALMWSALTYTKPWGTCGGETGYWGAPPAEQEL